MSPSILLADPAVLLCVLAMLDAVDPTTDVSKAWASVAFRLCMQGEHAARIAVNSYREILVRIEAAGGRS